jgi:hypothetical protein
MIIPNIIIPFRDSISSMEKPEFFEPKNRNRETE